MICHGKSTANLDLYCDTRNAMFTSIHVQYIRNHVYTMFTLLTSPSKLSPLYIEATQYTVLPEEVYDTRASI